jgi:hypothetical protein
MIVSWFGALARVAQPPVQRGFCAAVAEEDWRQFDLAGRTRRAAPSNV